MYQMASVDLPTRAPFMNSGVFSGEPSSGYSSQLMS